MQPVFSMNAYSSLVDMIRQNAARRPDHRAVVAATDAQRDETALTYSELYRQAASLAARLAEQAPPGERALLLFPTGLEFVVSYFACLMAGIIAVPLMPPRKNSNHDASAPIIADCAPRLVLTQGDRDNLHASLRQRFADRGVVHMPVNLPAALPETDPDITRRIDPSAESLAFLQYTSGSTSVPRGVMVSHGNLLANLEMMRLRLGNTEASNHVSWIPLYHDLGLIMNLLQPLYVGATSVLMSPSGFMHRPLSWLRAIHRHGAEVAAAPNFAYDLCVDRFRPDQMAGVDLSAWKLAVNGAEPVRAETLERFAECFRPYGFDAASLHPTYGLAEATLVVSSAPRGRGKKVQPASARALQDRKVASPDADADVRKIVGCGTALDGLEIAIVHPDARHRQAGNLLGEIWVKGANVAQGYWGRSNDSDAHFRATIAGEDEAGGVWLRTGDLGYVDQDNELYIAGRLKDVIIIRGVNHYPQDIEATAAEAHQALRRDHGAVFTVPDANGNESVILVQEVERTQRHKLDEKEIQASIRSCVVDAHDISLSKIVLIRPGAIPKTTSGKIQRHRARQLWLEGALDAQSATPLDEPTPQQPAASV